ncbi:hypothetical protein [Streptomonospora nanhaiensis]|uniref:hypothetical protein n=1 Tax=Streptomonospora nanhaiensis TaxID=1323731 RepID=UPI001C38C197|nr:hypothetical protein [Streptomonospora nanhaiensis]MBV2365719.1 hypothetical protein [Streptomonospora nanhaiensis]
MSPSSDWRHQAFMAGHLSPRALAAAKTNRERNSAAAKRNRQNNDAAATRRHITENTEANIRGSSSR